MTVAAGGFTGHNAPTSAEFLRTLGQVTWLMGLSPAHRDLPIRDIEARIQAPLFFKQLRVFSEGNRPIAAVTWATVSAPVAEALRFPQYAIQLRDWQSGNELVIVDCISPFVERARIESLFWDHVRSPNSPSVSVEEN